MLKLQGYLTSIILPRITKKGFFSSQYIYFDEYISTATHVFETSSVIGYTFRDQLASLVEIMAQDGGGGNLLKAIGAFPETRLTKQKEKPKNFFDFFFQSEAIHILEIIKKPNLIKECESGDYRNAFKLKLPYAFAFTHMQMIIAEGIGFGSHYP